MLKQLTYLLLLTVALISCKQKYLTEGDYLLPVKGGNIWYKIVGNGNKTPLVMIHGQVFLAIT